MLPAVAVTAVGAPGTVNGVTAALADDAREEPAALVAVTVNVYAVPLIRPVTVAVVAPVVVAVCPPGAAVTVYPVIAPPLEAGSDQDTVADKSPAVARTPVGASGAGFGVTATLGIDAGEAPATLEAVTVNV